MIAHFIFSHKRVKLKQNQVWGSDGVFAVKFLSLQILLYLRLKQALGRTKS